MDPMGCSIEDAVVFAVFFSEWYQVGVKIDGKDDAVNDEKG